MAETLKKPDDKSDLNRPETRESGKLHAVADQALGAAQQIGEKSADVVRRGAATAAAVTRHTAESATRAGEKLAEATMSAGESGADAASQTAQSAENIAGTAADQGGEVIRTGLLAMASLHGPLADAGYQQGQRALEITSRMTEVYRQAAERAAGDVRALYDFWMSFGTGLQRYQQAYVDALRQQLTSLLSKREDFARSTSPVHFAEIQGDTYVDLVRTSLGAHTRLVQLAVQVLQDSAGPLQERVQAQG